MLKAAERYFNNVSFVFVLSDKADRKEDINPNPNFLLSGVISSFFSYF